MFFKTICPKCWKPNARSIRPNQAYFNSLSRPLFLYFSSFVSERSTNCVATTGRKPLSPRYLFRRLYISVSFVSEYLWSNFVFQRRRRWRCRRRATMCWLIQCQIIRSLDGCPPTLHLLALTQSYNHGIARCMRENDTLSMLNKTSVTRLCDLLDFGQLF